MVKILLSNVGGTDNLGICMMLQALISNVDADFYVNNLTVCRDYEKYGLKYTWRFSGFDVALDLGGDTFTLYYGVLQFLRHSFHLFLHVLFNQKFILFAQTFSSYGQLRWMALFFMKRAALITVREKESYDLLSSLGVKCYLTADLAFLLETWKSDDYSGESYHKIIGALLSGKSGVWDGKRNENFKFKIFRKPLSIKNMRKKAGVNLDLLERILSD